MICPAYPLYSSLIILVFIVGVVTISDRMTIGYLTFLSGKGLIAREWMRNCIQISVILLFAQLFTHLLKLTFGFDFQTLGNNMFNIGIVTFLVSNVIILIGGRTSSE